MRSLLARRRRVWVVVALLPLCGAGGLLGAWLAERGRPRATTHHSPSWPVLVVVLVVIVAAGGSLLLARRRYTRPGRVRSLVAAGDANDLRRVARLVRRGRAVPADDRDLAQAYVDLLPRQAVLGCVMAGLGLLEVLLQLRTRSAGVAPPVLVVLGGVGGLVVAGHSVVVRRRALAQGIVAAARTPRRR